MSHSDNGAYYYYQTEGHTGGNRISEQADTCTSSANASSCKWAGPGKDYQQTLIDVHEYAEQEKIPYKYILLDSWWYYQGVGGGVTEWIGRPDIFPEGNSYLRNKTGWPIMGHNRYWAIDASANRPIHVSNAPLLSNICLDHLANSCRKF